MLYALQGYPSILFLMTATYHIDFHNAQSVELALDPDVPFAAFKAMPSNPFSKSSRFFFAKEQASYGPSFVPASNAMVRLVLERFAEREDYPAGARDRKLAFRNGEKLADFRWVAQ